MTTFGEVPLIISPILAIKPPIPGFLSNVTLQVHSPASSVSKVCWRL